MLEYAQSLGVRKFRLADEVTGLERLSVSIHSALPLQVLMVVSSCGFSMLTPISPGEMSKSIQLLTTWRRMSSQINLQRYFGRI